MKRAVSMTCAGLLLVWAPLRAHHSFAAEFDVNKPLELEGTLKKWEMVNPHSWFHIDVKGPDGAVVTWMVEGGSPNQLIRMPAGMDFTIAASVGLAYGTSYYALIERGQLQSGETLLVLGASGGVGLAAIEIGKILGARVIACASTDAKLSVCRQHGADELVNYAAEDMRARVKALRDGNGVDVAYDPVGGAYSERALRDMAWGGRLLVVGFASGDIPKIPLNLPLIKGCSIVGVWWGAFAKRDWAQHQANIGELGRWFAEGRIKPHIAATYSLEQAAEALNALARRTVTGKLILTTER